MQVLKSLGTVANGWAKFVVTLLAAGWFGVYALNEMRRVHGQTTSRALNSMMRGCSMTPQSERILRRRKLLSNPQIRRRMLRLNLRNLLYGPLDQRFGQFFPWFSELKMLSCFLRFSRGRGLVSPVVQR